MKFIYADALDYVDPRFDFVNDTYGKGRDPYWDDAFSHEILDRAPYDGMLVSRAVVGSSIKTGSAYTESQAMRFKRVGAREFFRLTKPEYQEMLMFGDCGAFSYSKEEKPPYHINDTIEFYGEGQFTHGCSIDHIIFEFDSNATGLKGGSEESKKRFEITLELADGFFKASKELGKKFTPIGVAQGWSPSSLAEAATRLCKMGYRYIAIGGLVPLNVNEIHMAVSAVEDAIKKWPSAKIHLLGFAKADQLFEFTKYKRIASFDSTSPMIKAFKDGTKNYFAHNGGNTLNYYTAIRIPQAIENNKLKVHAQSGRYKQETLLEWERDALKQLRLYDNNKVDINTVLESVIRYAKPLIWTPKSSDESINRTLHNLRLRYTKTLEDKPWKTCNCSICRDIGIETVIFRGSNRNRRRGMHNLDIYYDHLNKIKRQ